MREKVWKLYRRAKRQCKWARRCLDKRIEQHELRIWSKGVSLERRNARKRKMLYE